jgi:hypothetical protein
MGRNILNPKSAPKRTGGEAFMQGMLGFLVRHPTDSDSEILSLITFAIKYQTRVLGIEGYNAITHVSKVELHAKYELWHFIRKHHDDLKLKHIRALKTFLDVYQAEAWKILTSQQLKADPGVSKDDVAVSKLWKSKGRNPRFFKISLDPIVESSADLPSPNEYIPAKKSYLQQLK